MPKVTFIQAGGREFVAEAGIGETVMHVAASNGVDGIIAECGGALSCATCHVFVNERFLPLLAPRTDGENEMLEFTAAPRVGNSRLSCQIFMTEVLDGLVVTVADPQS